MAVCSRPPTLGTVRPLVPFPRALGLALLLMTGGNAMAGPLPWSLGPLKQAPLPDAPPHTGLTNPVDRLLYAAARRAPAPEAPPRVLFRRLSFDLLGLPPDPAEAEAFARGNPSATYAGLVDRLLESPHFGERWARHWLDIARYADSAGYERDSDRPTAWHYRDFVIRGFNEDLPFDRFTRWQLAGDLLAPDDPGARAAVAFLGLGPQVETDTQLKEELARYRYADLDDMLSTTGAAFLGLTLGCARCHDHKYDPISMRDYYSLLGAFVGVERRELQLGGAAGGASAARLFTVGEMVSNAPANPLMLRGDPTHPAGEMGFAFPGALSHGRAPADYVPGLRPEARRRALAAWVTDAEGGAGLLVSRVIVNRIWQHHFGEGLVPTPADFGTQGEPPQSQELLDWLAAELIRGGWRLKPIHRLLVNSRYYRETTQRPGAIGTPVRQPFARHPLRVEAEILRDAILAVSGTLNPALYGPSVKGPIPAGANVAYNTRDPYPTNAPDTFETRRRSLYLFSKRSLRHPLLEAFDAADPSASCSRRIPTTVAPQALTLLNDGFIRARAGDFARRLEQEAGPRDRDRVDRAYGLALGRAPVPREREAATRFLGERTGPHGSRFDARDPGAARHEALADFCQVLFALNEFFYID